MYKEIWFQRVHTVHAGDKTIHRWPTTHFPCPLFYICSILQTNNEVRHYNLPSPSQSKVLPLKSLSFQHPPSCPASPWRDSFLHYILFLSPPPTLPALLPHQLLFSFLFITLLSCCFLFVLHQICLCFCPKSISRMFVNYRESYLWDKKMVDRILQFIPEIHTPLYPLKVASLCKQFVQTTNLFL